MSLLDYIAKDPSVQIAFLFVVALALVVSLVFFNLRKAKKLDHDLRVIEPVNRNMPVVRDDY
jgi:hypothetical protein